MPDGSDLKKQWTAKLAELGGGVGNAIFSRVNEIKQRIEQANEKLESLSGGDLIVRQAFIHSLENIQVKYYQTLVNHLKSRKTLNLSSDELRNRLDPKLYLYAETLAGRIELSNSARQEAELRADQDPGNTDITTVITRLNSQHALNVSRLHAVVLVLDDLKLNSSDYKTVLLEQTGDLSVSFFSPKVAISVLMDGWQILKSGIKDNAPDILFRVLIFIIILFVFRILSRVSKRLVRAASERATFDMSSLLKNILVSTIGGTIMAIGVLVALSQIGISLAPMLAGLGVAGFIVGFALQDTLGNFAAGAMILIYRPFDIDDIVEVTGASGIVKKMNLVSTTISPSITRLWSCPTARSGAMSSRM